MGNANQVKTNQLEKKQIAGYLYEIGFKMAILNGAMGEFPIPPLVQGSISGNFEDKKKLFYEEVNKICKKAHEIGLTNWAKILGVGKYTAVSVVKSDGIENEKFLIGELLPQGLLGNYRNADVLLYSEKNQRLVVYELTFDAFHKHSRLSEGVLEDGIKRSDYSPEFSFSVDEFLKLAEEIVSYAEKHSRIFLQKSEALKTLQGISYILSFLEEKDLPVKRIIFRVVLPFGESVTIDLPLRQDYKKVIKEKNLKERAVEIYSKMKNFYKEGSGLKNGKVEDFILYYADREIKKIQGKDFYPQRHIEYVRKIVPKIVFNSKPLEVNILAHPPGSGKTSAVIKFASSFDKVLFLHFSPRRSIVEDKRKKMEEMGFLVIEDTKEYQETGSVGGIVRKKQDKGRLKAVKERFIVKMAQTKAKKVAIISTTQAITRITGFNFDGTHEHLKEIVEVFLSHHPDGKIIVTIDEVLGAKNSIPALKEVVKVFLDLNLKENVYFFALDANICTCEVAEKIFEKLNRSPEEAVPEFVCEARGDGYSENPVEVKEGKKYFGVPTLISSVPTFPTKEYVKVEVKPVESRAISNLEIIDELYKEYKQTGEKFFIYVQDKSLAFKFAKRLQNKGLKVAVITSIRKTSKVEHFGKKDVVIATSSLSRGVDVPFSKMYAILADFNFEVQMAEVLQAFARIRKGKEEENKRIILIAPYIDSQEIRDTTGLDSLIPDNSPKWNLWAWLSAFSKIKASKVLKFAVQLIEFTVQPDKNKKYLVPIPAILPSYMKGTEGGMVRVLLEYLRDRKDFVGSFLEKHKVRKEDETIWMTYASYKEEEEKWEHPYRFFKGIARFKFSKNYIEAIKEALENDREVSETRKEELRGWLKRLSESNSFYTPGDVLLFAHLYPTMAYREVYKKLEGRVFLLNQKSLGRKGYPTLPSEVVLKNGKLCFPILGDEIFSYSMILPRFPIELLPL